MCREAFNQRYSLDGSVLVACWTIDPQRFQSFVDETTFLTDRAIEISQYLSFTIFFDV